MTFNECKQTKNKEKAINAENKYDEQAIKIII
jgi:hypothetical protein